MVSSVFRQSALIIAGFTLTETVARQKAQLQAVLAVRRVAQGHRRRPFVLTADRGRGKSASLGIAAASLIKEGAEQIIVTAPSMAAADVIFRHAADRLGVAIEKAGVIRWRNSLLMFKAPDELANQQEPCDLLLVDEAAAIPAPLLKRLLNAYARIVFSSTIHGYEGTGRGFSVRISENARSDDASMEKSSYQ